MLGKLNAKQLRNEFLKLKRSSAFKAEFARVLDQYEGLCAYCGGNYDTIDHVVPLTKGGTNDVANLKPCCFLCNTRKRNKSLGDFLQLREFYAAERYWDRLTDEHRWLLKCVLLSDGGNAHLMKQLPPIALGPKLDDARFVDELHTFACADSAGESALWFRNMKMELRATQTPNGRVA